MFVVCFLRAKSGGFRRSHFLEKRKVGTRKKVAQSVSIFLLVHRRFLEDHGFVVDIRGAWAPLFAVLSAFYIINMLLTSGELDRQKLGILNAWRPVSAMGGWNQCSIDTGGHRNWWWFGLDCNGHVGKQRYIAYVCLCAKNISRENWTSLSVWKWRAYFYIPLDDPGATCAVCVYM